MEKHLKNSINAGVAQSVEQLNGSQQVEGSNPFISTIPTSILLKERRNYNYDSLDRLYITLDRPSFTQYFFFCTHVLRIQHAKNQSANKEDSKS